MKMCNIYNHLFLIFIFRKLISYELQRIGLTIVLLSGLLIFQEIRTIVKRYLAESKYLSQNLICKIF